MKRKLPTLALAWFCLCCSISTQAGTAILPDPGTPPSAPAGAITVSLSIPSYTFWVDMMPGPFPQTRTYGSFTAVFNLANLSGYGLDLDLIDSASLLPKHGRKIVFVMRDEAGNELWRRPGIDARILAPVLIRPVTLPNGRIWRASVSVPLAPNGKVLPSGSYTLEAFINGTPRYSATAPFEVGYAY